MVLHADEDDDVIMFGWWSWWSTWRVLRLRLVVSITKFLATTKPSPGHRRRPLARRFTIHLGFACAVRWLVGGVSVAGQQEVGWIVGPENIKLSLRCLT